MLSFATEFPIKQSDTQVFVKAVQHWIQGSPHTSFKPIDFDGTLSEGRWVCSAGREHLESLIASDNNTKTAAFRHTAYDGDIQWRTTIVQSTNEDDSWVSVRTDRESNQAQISLPSAKKPQIVKMILAGLGGGLDGEMFVSDKPFYLRQNDLGMATRLLNADADNYLPVIYISRTFSGDLDINPIPLAKVLGGVAHVLVEPDRAFSRALQSNVGSRNVYGGSAGVYWPNGEFYKYFINESTPTEFDVRQLLSARVRSALLNRRPLPRCTWSRAEADVAREAFNRLRNSGSENVEEYAAVFDSELRAKDKQLEDAEGEIRRLKMQVRSFDTNRTKPEKSLDISNEQEFFPGEFLNIIGDAVRTAVENSQDGSRRAHVLHAFSENLTNCDVLKERRDKLKSFLRDYRAMSKPIKAGLEELGFSLSEEGKHIKVIYMNDDRYAFILPRSGSDNRGGLNGVSDIAKRVY